MRQATLKLLDRLLDRNNQLAKLLMGSCLLFS
jgi:hypothetical protein